MDNHVQSAAGDDIASVTAPGTIVWGRSGADQNNFEVGPDSRSVTKVNGDGEQWTGAVSTCHVPRGHPVLLRITSPGNRFYSYYGLACRDALQQMHDLRLWESTVHSYIKYHVGEFSGIHDSEHARTSRSSDWLGGVVPMVRSGDVISMEHTKSDEVVVSVGGEQVYKQSGFKDDLFFFASMSFVGESVEIVDMHAVENSDLNTIVIHIQSALSGNDVASVTAQCVWQLSQARRIAEEHLTCGTCIQHLKLLSCDEILDQSRRIEDVGLETGAVLQAVLGTIMWGHSSANFDIGPDGRSVTKVNGHGEQWTGVVSTCHVPRGHPVLLRITSPGNRFYSYYGLACRDALQQMHDLRFWESTVHSYIKYYVGEFSGIHDSEHARTSRSSDWLGNAVPMVRSGGIISMEHTRTDEVVVSVGGKQVYKQRGFNDDLYLIASMAFVGESVEIVDSL